MTRDGLSFLGRPLPPAFRVRAVVIAPGGARRYAEAEWADAIVVVERGAIDLEFLGGGRTRYVRGDTLTLSELALRALHNRGAEPALLVAVSRR
jgi:hypothetical protein